jgi:siroheme synthase (precorrin-2 oxidase/ferrochelatase)
MILPRIVRTGVIFAHGRDVEVNGGDSLHVVLLATADETEDARALSKAKRARITIEPADAPEPGSALDYLEELKVALTTALAGQALAVPTQHMLRRCMSLANASSLAILAEKRRQP